MASAARSIVRCVNSYVKWSGRSLETAFPIRHQDLILYVDGL